MKKTNYKTILICLLVSVFIFSMTSLVSFSADTPDSSTSYVPLEPGAFGQDTLGSDFVDSEGRISTSDLSSFLAAVFSFGIAIAAALAVVMIAFGGIQYMTTDAWTKKEEGKERINNALLGLALALISYLILYTINPSLVDFTNNAIVQTTPR